MLAAIFGDKKTMKQKIRESKRTINRSIREIDREINRLKREKKKNESEAKRLSKQGQMDAVKTLCKEIVTINDETMKIIKLKSLLRSLSTQFDNAPNGIGKSLNAVNKCYQSVSKRLILPELQKMITEFSVESEQMEMKQEMINDAMDDALAPDSDYEDEMIQKVMDEIGLDSPYNAQFQPRMRCMAEQAEATCIDNDLESRLTALKREDNTIGLSVGGAKDVNNFRKCIEQNMMPSTNSITYNGLLYEYYFDTKTRKHVNKNYNVNNDEKIDPDDTGNNLFYPSYCYAKIKKSDFLKYEETQNEYEYYMTVGLNSNIKMNDFKRKHLNLIIVLDKSGSMGSRFYGDNTNKTKMEIANESVVALLKHLTPKDRFGLVTFESKAQTIHDLKFVNDYNISQLKQSIFSIKQSGGTNFECGYNKAITSYTKLFKDNEYKLNSIDYDNRIILLTDAKPNSGVTNANCLLSMVTKYAENESPKNINDHDVDIDQEEYIRNRIYTTFIGIGIDFNSDLIQIISKARGCNYYSVKSTKDFMDKMDQEFEYMVTPLVFNVSLKLKCEGNSCEIEKVYGSHNESNIKKNGEISKIDTLFPAKRKKINKKGPMKTKGGIQLIKLRKNNNNKNDDNINVEIEVSFEDRNGKKYKNQQIVIFESPKLHDSIKNDMIENDEIEEKEEEIIREKENFYDNTGIRKGILLCKYVELMLDWINKTQSGTLKINDKYKKLFTKFIKYFEKEMKILNDDDLKKEIEIIQKLINLNINTISTVNTTSNNMDDVDDDLRKRLAMLQ